MQAASGLAECAALLGIGYQLRQSGFLRSTDGQTALRLANYLTLPSVIIRSLCCSGPLPAETWLGAGAAMLVFATQAAATWLQCASKQKRERERAVLMGCSVGLALPTIGLPVADAVLGGSLQALQPLVLATLVNAVAVRGTSYLFFGSAGPAFPEAFRHEDGGVYRGQWRGLRKEGLGSYTYVSGARYEGEWKDNVKDGRGVYYYPKGGTYEGEWAGGMMNGVGVRTLSTGEVRAGRWRNGQLEEPLELWQCTYAAEGAAEAALAARNVEVGGGTLKDAAGLLLQYAPLWAGVVALGYLALGQPLPQALDAVTEVLAPANRPLMLLAAGSLLKVELPSLAEVAEVSQLLATRVLVPVVVCGSLLLLAKPGDTLGLTYAAVLLLGFMAPLAPEVTQYAHSFRLSEARTSIILSASTLLAAPLLILATLAVGLSTALPDLLSALRLPADQYSATQPLLVFCAVVVGVVAAGMGYLGGQAETLDRTLDRRVLMVYTGPPQAAAGAVGSSAAGMGGASGTGGNGGRGSDGGGGSGGRGSTKAQAVPGCSGRNLLSCRSTGGALAGAAWGCGRAADSWHRQAPCPGFQGGCRGRGSRIPAQCASQHGPPQQAPVLLPCPGGGISASFCLRRAPPLAHVFAGSRLHTSTRVVR